LISSELNRLLNELDLISNDCVLFPDENRKWRFFSTETNKKLEKISPDAVYSFNDLPFILFFDLSNISDSDNDREKNIHKQVWSFDQAPLVFVIKDTEVKIFNAFAYEKRQKQLQEIVLDEGETRKNVFSFWKLESGEAWNWLQKNYYKDRKQKNRNKRVNQKLFDNIKLVRTKLMNELSENDANTLILRLIFIRYLIDRNVKINPDFIQGDSVVRRRVYFSELIREPKKLNLFFNELKSIFNGILFKEEIPVTSTKAEFLSLVFSEKDGPFNNSLFDGVEDFYFNIFDFNIIPVELISGIYETLINPETREADSAFYTPLFLVEYILSNTIDNFFKEEKNKNKSECKVFDASVGSGIFLVQAFRRMVDREMKITGKTNLPKTRLAEIAQNNLFGIDINPEALKVACFSIYIAILDYEDPGTIMDKFPFPDLHLLEGDVFDTTDDFNEIINGASLDFILGNPPWKKDKSKEHLEWVNSRKIYKKRITGKIEIAQNFLLRILELAHENTLCSLIISSPVFYNISSTSRTFKNKFLTSTDINDILDLSPVRRFIFEGEDNPALIITFKKTKGNYEDSLIKHSSVKANLFTKHFKALVIEKFDQKQILQKYFVENEWMFKVALYGNTLDYFFLKRITTAGGKIFDLINGKEVVKGAGILKGNIYDFNEYTPIVNKIVIENKQIKPFFSPVPEPHHTISTNEAHIKSGRINNLFEGYQILIKEQTKDESQIVISLNNDLVFRKGIFGISSNNSLKINEIYSYLISNLYTYYIFITSCAWGVSTRPQIRFKEEYLSFPFIESNNKEELIQLVNQFLKPFKEFYSQEMPMGDPPKNEKIINKINEVIFETYQIKNYEKDLIDYVLDVSRYQFQESKLNRILRKVNNDEKVLKAYAEVFFDEFERIYNDEYMSVEIYNLDYFIALNFIFNEKEPQEKIRFVKGMNEKMVLEKLTKTLSISRLSKDLFIQKDIKGFEENSFYIIKPNEYKCWHRALAWYDSSEIKEAIQSAELERLKLEN
jgi:hypothetical protein